MIFDAMEIKSDEIYEVTKNLETMIPSDGNNIDDVCHNNVDDFVVHKVRLSVSF